MALKITAWAMVLIGAAAAAGSPIAPFVGGTIHEARRGATDKPRPLSGPQLQALYAWLDARKTNLHVILASPPPPACSVLLSDEGGRRVELDLYSANENWKRAVQITIWDANGKFLYGGEMSLPTADMVALSAMLQRSP